MTLDFSKEKKTILFLLIPALLVYAKSLFFDFSPMDDQWMIVENQKDLSDWSNIGDFFTKPLAGLYFRPIFSLTLMIDYHLGKLSPFIYHFSNLLFHLLVVFLVYKLLLKFQVAQKTSLWLSILFSLHPLLIHAVVWIPGRNDSLLAIFSITAIIYLIKFISEQHQKYLYYHLLFFLGALLTKETAVVLPLCFVMSILWLKPISKKYVVLIACWFFIISGWLALRHICVNSTLSLSHDVLNSIKNFCLAIILYIGKSLFPVQQSVFPPLQNSTIVYGIITLIIYGIVVWKVGLKNKLIALFGLALWAIIISIPTWYGATSVLGEHYEHRMYLPLIGLLVFVSQLNFNQNSPLFLYSIYFFALLYGFKTFMRQDVYKTSDTFLENGMKEAPDYYFFYAAKADHLLKENKNAEAIPLYDKAIKLQPHKAQLYSARGFAYTNIKKIDLAIADFTKAIELSNHPDMYLNRCLAYILKGDYQLAFNDLEYLKKNSPQTIPDGLEKEILGYLSDIALKELNVRITNEPLNAVLYIHRAKVLITRNNLMEAKKDIEKACEIEPNNQMFQLYKQQIMARLK
ncbi:MAG: glycosyltransferase family 39 protein [Bacteroidia bacterium]|nr:glycosyltransferase family 39 protein [Bacteroidia bacterium]